MQCNNGFFYAGSLLTWWFLFQNMICMNCSFLLILMWCFFLNCGLSFWKNMVSAHWRSPAIWEGFGKWSVFNNRVRVNALFDPSSPFGGVVASKASLRHQDSFAPLIFAALTQSSPLASTSVQEVGRMSTLRDSVVLARSGTTWNWCRSRASAPIVTHAPLSWKATFFDF